MSITWQTWGRLVYLTAFLLLTAVFGWPASINSPYEFIFIILGAAGFLCCAGLPGLYFTGALKIRCPLCQAVGTLSTCGRGRRYTGFVCPNHGEVRGQGFFSTCWETDRPFPPDPPAAP